MYETFFNLHTKPFELVPNPEFIFLSKSHKKALTFIDYGIRERAGFILLTGDVGSGKTTLIRDLINKNYDQVILGKVYNTKVTSDQLLAMINDDFGLPVIGKGKIELIRDLNNFLVDQYAIGNQPILIIDEAQNLSPELLEEVRLLSNLETADTKLLQIIIAGQPELRKTLATPELLQLRQRISINCHLQPLTREETGNYILHRLEVAGSSTGVIFEEESVDVIYHNSKGIPRLINIICDFLLLSAFAEETKNISADMTREIVGDLDLEYHFWADSDSNVIKDASVNTTGAVTFTDNFKEELFSILHNITDRLTVIENNSNAGSEEKVTELTERIESLNNAFKFHTKETDTSISDLSRRIEKLSRSMSTEIDNDSSLDKSDKSYFFKKMFR